MNILFILADQMRADVMGCAGHPLIETPHLDRLAEQGTRFTHAFTPIAVCTPARNSLLYGCWPHRHGAIANQDTEAPRGPFPHLMPWSRLLHEAGWWQGYVGKWHDMGQAPQTLGFDRFVAEGEYAVWRAAQGLPPPPRTNGWLGETDPHITLEQSRLAWGANQTIDLMRQGQDSGNPWLVWWSPSEPHLPNVIPEALASQYPPDTIAPFPSFSDDLRGKPWIQAEMRRIWNVDSWTWADWQPLVSRYLATVRLLDTQVGRILSALDTLGMADNTLVVFSSDHGDMTGSHGMLDKHYVGYDDVLRVPLLARFPGGKTGQPVQRFTIHALDLAASFCELAQLPPPATFQGASLLPFLRGASVDEPDAVFAQYMGGHLGLYSQRVVRTRAHKYLWNTVAEDELYDLAADPWEIVNCAADPAYQSILSDLRARLVQQMEATHDPLLNPWTRSRLLTRPSR